MEESDPSPFILRYCYAILMWFSVTMAWCILRLQMEETASTYEE